MCRGMHVPPHRPGHAATQFWLIGPGGDPPLMYERTLAADAEDGHWSWQESGRAEPFEQVSRYASRGIQDRFDRALLIDYMLALGIAVDAPSF